MTMDRQEEFRHYLKKTPWYHVGLLEATKKLASQIRTCFGNKYLSGEGIEIGAEGNPLIVDIPDVSIRYVDRLLPEESSQTYAIPLKHLVRPDYMAEADELSFFPDKKFDFVIANHLLEHMVDPIKAVIEWLRILRDNGILFLTVPNYRCNEYDFCRKPADIDHLINDYREQPQDMKDKHWREFITKVEGIDPEDPSFGRRMDEFRKIDFRIHMHVFNIQLLLAIIRFLTTIGERVTVLDAFHFKYSYEILLILKKGDHAGTKLNFRMKLWNLLLLSKLGCALFMGR